ncbi:MULTISPECIES: 23S rRNA (guanosine(2251)-2'-O)-methyltransferase RlmB [Thiomicrorhabdus]|uniref:23S rRNA (guanosine-2'-O-)-methyltransferase RlmB n=1 Tax=Thiomicrorhabdus heinhorstiae TaxID=2748010 RepID=A0ABS0BY65_9GAMM|nr:MULTISPECIES: 23S rRNA (guanosine(2251)-2'-O)-methyltransferase RlmB [Thiomicrorhabdus]MBF6058732.1 23S rRNA (guanosine(2251)-2'-O)-methyltransferase RlmB [Thiomicrorhabdus heinhorstiae]
MSSEVIYGLHAVEKFIKQSPQSVYSIRFVKGRLNGRQQALFDQAKALGLSPQFVAKTEFKGFDEVNHQGVLAEVAKQADLTESDLQELVENTANPLVIFLDEVQDPHNLGAILRTADAVGVTAVVIPKHNSVGMNATVRKVASGAADNVKLIVVSNLVRTIKQLQSSGMWMIGLAGETDLTIYDQDLTGSIGIVMGAEGSGLRRLTKEACDHLAAIPMVGVVESLNVSVATGIAVYEAFRQRSR